MTEANLKKENRLLRIALAIMALSATFMIINNWRAENRLEEKLERALQCCEQARE